MIVYKITNKINGKLYFGISKCSIKKRWNEHKSKSRSGKSHLSLAIKKYGVSSFCIELIRECFSEKEMYDLEIDFIKKYKTNNPLYGYNNSCGGEVSSKGKTLSDETRRKISEYQKVRDRKPHSEQAKKNMSILAKGRDMTELSELLSEAINSIIDCKEESDVDSLFSAGGTSALMSAVSGLDDFELICFLVVK